MSRRTAASPRLPTTLQLNNHDSTPTYLDRPHLSYNDLHVRRPGRLLGQLKRPVVFLPTLALLLLAAVTFNKGAGPGATYANKLQAGVDRFKSATGVGYGAASNSSPRKAPAEGEFSCNPFETHGRLHVDLDHPTLNLWKPYDSHCHPSNYLSHLYRDPADSRPPPPATSLPWFANRTVVIHGDSIDRFHLKDFCAFVHGRLISVGPDHPASPAPYRQAHEPAVGPDGQETQESRDRQRARQDKETFWEGRPREGIELTNPWVCDIEEYGTTLISVFTWGLQGAEEFFETERWYYPPATWVDRLTAITKPLLPRLAAFLNRPQIEFPDLIELNSGFWDLRKYTEEDFVAAGFLSRPYPEDSPIPYTNLSPKREAVWEAEARQAIKSVAHHFPGRDGLARSGPAILWRTLHHPPRHNYAPFPRVFALDSLARKVVLDLQAEADRKHGHLPPAKAGAATGEGDEDLGLDERLRVDMSGALMLGQEHHFRDLLHPEAVPGSYLWGDVMLYELKRAVQKVGRS